MNTKKAFQFLALLVLIFSLLPMPETHAAAPSGAGPRLLEGGQRDLLWPVPGAYNLSSCFLDNRNHRALDIAADMGTTIIASYGGTVTETYTSCEHYDSESSCSCGGSYGNYVVVKHNYVLKNGSTITLYTRYAHMTKVSVSVGQTVSAGTKLGTVGSTGRSSGPHLHFEALKDSASKSNSLDPYVNDLLELPDELHSTFNSHCREYVSYVKSLYPRCTHESYDSQGNCTACGYAYNWKDSRNTAAMGHYTVNTDVEASKLPYSGAETVFSLSQGAAVTVNATVTNGLGETWYEVSLSGVTGYVPKAALSFSDYLDSEFQGKLSSLTEGQVLKQSSHRVDGSVSSRYPLRSVKGYLDGDCYATWSSSGNTTELSFGGSVINSKLKFSKLAPGKHTLTITVTDSTNRGETQILQCTFYIEQPPTYYTVTFSGGESQAVEVLENTAIGELPTPTREGFTFLGWFTGEDAGDPVTADTVITQSITFYPHWEAITYTVTLGDTALTIPHGAYIETFPALSMPGYTLVGWFTAETGGEEMTGQTPITGDMILFPQWTPNEYILTLDAGNGEPSHQRTVTFGESYGVLPTPTQEGYTFLGWFLEGTLITEDTPITTSAHHTLTAQWELIPTEPPTAPAPEAPEPAAPSALWLIPLGIFLAGSICLLTAWLLQKRAPKIPVKT